MSTKDRKKIKFKDFITLQRWFDLPDRDRQDGNFPIIASTSITWWHNQYKVEPPVITTGRSWSLGSVLYTNQRSWPLNTTLRVKDFKCNEPRFIFYYLQTLHLEKFNAGAGVPTLNRNHLDNLDLIIPLLPTQQTIASILSKYDDLIENNNQRIKILEQEAELIYKEWFVKFKFPWWEKAKMECDWSESGVVPEWWGMKKIKDFCDIKSWFSFKSSDFDDNWKYWLVTIKNVQDGFFVPKCTDYFNTLPNKLPEYCILKDWDILLSLTGNVWRICLVYGDDYLLNQRVAKLVAKNKLYNSFLYCLFKNNNMRTKLEGISKWAAQQNLSPIETWELLVCLPDDNNIKSFEKIVWPMIWEIISLNKQDENLKQTRDMLLPKLISGEVVV